MVSNNTCVVSGALLPNPIFIKKYFPDYLMKKGVISIQFNWIFVLIAGAVLFAFFIGITLHQGDQAKKERQFNALTGVEATLTNVEQSVINLSLIHI